MFEYILYDYVHISIISGLGHHQQRSIPDINEYFRKEGIKVKDVKLSKFHSAFISTDGQVYTW